MKYTQLIQSIKNSKIFYFIIIRIWNIIPELKHITPKLLLGYIFNVRAKAANVFGIKKIGTGTTTLVNAAYANASFALFINIISLLIEYIKKNQ